MHSCQEVLAALAGYFDDEVAADLRATLEAHLATCRSCRVIYDSTGKTLRILTDSQSFDLPEEVASRIMATLKEKIRSGQ